MSDLKSISFFDTLIYQAELPKYLADKDFMAVCDEHTDKAIADAKQSIDESSQVSQNDLDDDIPF